MMVAGTGALAESALKPFYYHIARYILCLCCIDVTLKINLSLSCCRIYDDAIHKIHKNKHQLFYTLEALSIY